MIKADPFSQLMLVNMTAPRGASAQMSFMTSSTSNNADSQIRRTAGGATLADSSVVPSKRSQATTFSVTSRSQTKVATRQLRKEGSL